MSPREQVSAHYLYRSLSSRRRGATLYLVARLEGSNVLARIEVVDPKHGASAHPSASRTAPLRVVSPWRRTASRHYAKARVTLAS
ncbi:MAG TPA: hypothetical protein VGG21_06430 [Acidimicrobiales bacterium]|jgi:hypothetical protein